ncbi:MAG: hypothetical protein IPJ52_04465 [Rhodocyclaceae bacterium]|nr:hypothetical protein [Rhodocyclaceae bacterium]
MPLNQEQRIALAHRHAQAEGDADVEATLATMEADPAYYFYPAGRKFIGMANTWRFTKASSAISAAYPRCRLSRRGRQRSRRLSGIHHRSRM